ALIANAKGRYSRWLQRNAARPDRHAKFSAGDFFSFTESKKELRIKTLSRLSGIESREIRRGSPYLLHWYGVPKRTADAEELPPRPLRKSRRDTPFAFFIFHVRQPPILNRL